ncbi:MAG: hypothetical protein ACXWZM_03660 [Solirubrobacterales bacterium]
MSGLTVSRQAIFRGLGAAGALVAIALIVLPTSASPKGQVAKGQVTISGGNRSAHVRIHVVRNTLAVTGGDVKGCQQSTQPGCRLAAVSSVMVRMGPYPDKVEVLDPLPVPLTVHLGGGSDKFIGNDEPDRCFSEGSIRNRCYGMGGDDVCITGERNSDCVGGPGDDVCKHGAGSDGCWGDAGDDVCYMGSGKDGCHGGRGDDRLYGGPDPDQLYGQAGRDWCSGGPGRGKSHTCELGPGH